MKNRILRLMAFITIGCLSLSALANQPTNIVKNLATTRKQAIAKIGQVGQKLQVDLKDLFKDLIKGLDIRNPEKMKVILERLIPTIIQNMNNLINHIQSGENNLENTAKEAFAKMQCLTNKRGTGCEGLNCSNEKECIVSIWKTIKPTLSILLENLLGTLENGNLQTKGVVALATTILPEEPTSQIGKKFRKTITDLTQAILTSYNLIESVMLILDFNPEKAPEIPLEPIVIEEEQLESIEGLEGFEDF